MGTVKQVEEQLEHPSAQTLRQSAGQSRLVEVGVWVFAWAAGLVGSLQLHKLDGMLAHNICGPWGCAAAPESLLGYHLFLVLLIAPPVVLASLFVRPVWRQRIGLLLFLAGVIGAGTMAAKAALDWRREGGDPQYTAHRAAFVVFTEPDALMIPVAAAGIAVMTAGQISRRTRRSRPRLSASAAEESPGTR